MDSSNHPLKPFPGLRPFEFHESNLFFGREDQSKELLNKLWLNRFVAVVGTSGSGKSSLVRAGLLPLLRDGLLMEPGPSWRIAVLRPGKAPLLNLARALCSAQSFESSYENKPEPASKSADQQENGKPDAQVIKAAAIETILRRSARGLVEHVRRTRIPKDENLLVIVDQFEELFRFKEDSDKFNSEDEAAAFVKLLLEAVREQELPIYVVLTMRSDFLGDCAQFRDLPETINESQYLIPRMTRDQQRSAIMSPASAYGAQIAPRLAQRLLNDAGDNPDHLPILQHALMRTWDHWRGNGTDQAIDLPQYDAIGTMSEALSRHADEAYEELPDTRARKIAEKLFKALTAIENRREVRRPTQLRDICDIAGAEMAEVVAVIENFRREGRSFLMPPPVVELTKESLIDISHESLIQGWGKLKIWVDEEARSARVYKFVADSAGRHKTGQASLLHAEDLKFVIEWRDKAAPNEAWARRYHDGLPQVLNFIRASEIARDKEQAEAERQQQEQIERERFQHKIEQALEIAERHRAEEAKLRAEDGARRAEAEAALAEEAKLRAENETRRAEAEAARAEEAKLRAEEATRRAEAEAARYEEAKLRAEAEAARAEEATSAAEFVARARERESEAAHRLAEERAKSTRRLRIAVVALVIMFLIAGAVAAYAFTKKQEAEKEKNNAEQAQATAEGAKALAVMNEYLARNSADSEAKAAIEARQSAEKELIARKAADQERAHAEEQRRLALKRESEAIEAKDNLKQTNAKLTISLNREQNERIAADKARLKESYSRDGFLALQMGEFDAAESNFLKAFDAYESDKEPDGQSWVKYNLGATYRGKNDYAKAEDAYKTSIEMLERAHGQRAQESLPSRDQLAHLYQEQGKYAESENHYQDMLEILRSPSSRSSGAYMVRIKSDIADLYRTQAKDMGIRLRQQEREITEALGKLEPNGSQEPKGASSQNPTKLSQIRKLGLEGIAAYCIEPDTQLVEQCQQYNDLRNTRGEKIRMAETYYTDVLSESEKTLPPDHPNLATLYINLGQVYPEEGVFSKASSFTSLGLKIRQLNATLNDSGELSLEDLQGLGLAFEAAHRLDKAGEIYTLVLERLQRNSATTPKELYGSFRNMARYYKKKKDYDKAERYFKEAFSISGTYGGALASDYGFFNQTLDYEMGRFYLDQKRYAEAETYYANLLKKLKKYAESDPTGVFRRYLAEVLDSLAIIYQMEGRNAEAIDSSKEALTVMASAAYEESPLLVKVLYNLAETYRKQSKSSEAEPLYIRAQQLMQMQIKQGKQFLPNLDRIFETKVWNRFSLTLSPKNYSDNLIGRASLYADLGRLQEAETLYKEALDTLDWINEALSTRYRGRHQNYFEQETCFAYVESLRGYAELLRKTGRQQEAIEKEKLASDYEARLKNLSEEQVEDEDDDSQTSSSLP